MTAAGVLMTAAGPPTTAAGVIDKSNVEHVDIEKIKFRMRSSAGARDDRVRSWRARGGRWGRPPTPAADVDDDPRGRRGRRRN